VEIDSQINDDILWIRISGRMVLDSTLIRLREHVMHGLETGVRRFAIDVSQVTHLDSCGCGEVISAHTSIHRANGSLVFINPAERVRLLWAHTKLDKVLNIFDTRENARDFLHR